LTSDGQYSKKLVPPKITSALPSNVAAWQDLGIVGALPNERTVVQVNISKFNTLKSLRQIVPVDSNKLSFLPP